MHKFNMSLFIYLFLNFNLVFLDRRLGFQPTLQRNGLNLKALQNETNLRASILSIALDHSLGFHSRPIQTPFENPLPSLKTKHFELRRPLNFGLSVNTM